MSVPACTTIFLLYRLLRMDGRIGSGKPARSSNRSEQTSSICDLHSVSLLCNISHLRCVTVPYNYQYRNKGFGSSSISENFDKMSVHSSNIDTASMHGTGMITGSWREIQRSIPRNRSRSHIPDYLRRWRSWVCGIRNIEYVFKPIAHLFL